jgi:hypothetical protein
MIRNVTAQLNMMRLSFKTFGLLAKWPLMNSNEYASDGDKEREKGRKLSRTLRRCVQ